MKRSFKLLLIGLSMVLCVGSGSIVMAQDVIKIGALATLEGAFTVLGQDAIRGIKLALKEHNNTAGGKKIELITMSSDASPDSAIRAAKKTG